MVSCSQGDVFLINGEGGNAPRLWGFVDNTNKIISVANSGISGDYLRIIAPANSAKCIINSVTAKYGLCFKGSLAYTLGLAIKGQGLNKTALSDANDADVNTIYTVFANTTSNVPGDGVLITVRFNSATGNGHTQIFVGSGGGDFYWRVYWSNVWREWQKAIVKTDPIVKGSNLTSTTLTDANNASTNTIYTVFTTSTENIPTDGVLITARFSAAAGNGHAQILVGSDAKLYTRVYWASTWRQWRTYSGDGVSAYDYNVMSMAMFEHFGVVGDSFASGEIVVTAGSYVDYYNQSWGQIIARRNGISCINFSEGGLNTRTWLTSQYGLALVQSSEPQNLYILALGINDNSLGASYIGSIEDITGHSSYTEYGDTFYGNYGRIIEQIQAKAPKAKMVILKTAFGNGNFPAIDTAIGEIAEHYDIPVINQKEDGYLSSSDYLSHMQNGHPTATMYSGMAISIERLMSKCMLTNYDYFKNYTGQTA